MSSKGEHQTVPLSVLLRREQKNEKIENPELSYGQASQSKKGEDFTLLKTECQRNVGDGVATFSVFGVFIISLPFSSSTCPCHKLGCFWLFMELILLKKYCIFSGNCGFQR